MELTKEQKLEIVSKAIDAGANIDINFHTDSPGVAPVSELKNILADMDATYSGSTKEKSRWINFWDGNSRFRAVVFLPEIPPEWQDTGDEADA